MGQAQLLLIVLGVVLVGIAIIAGIQAYSTNNEKASMDAQVHDLMRIGSDIQTWVQKPQQFGGPATYADLSAVTSFDIIGYTTGGATSWTNPNATYSLSAGDPVEVTSTNSDLGTFAHLVVCGIKDNEVAVAVAKGTAPGAPGCPLGTTAPTTP